MRSCKMTNICGFGAQGFRYGVRVYAIALEIPCMRIRALCLHMHAIYRCVYASVYAFVRPGTPAASASGCTTVSGLQPLTSQLPTVF